MNNGRRLIYVPILHTQQDMGSLAPAARKTYVNKLGQKLWRHHVRAIDEMWSGIKKRIARLKLPYKKTYVYQDGLPVCDKELEIIHHLAKQGSPNHLILEGLVKKGATLVGTEDPHLLKQEYNWIKQILTVSHNGQKKTLLQEYGKVAPELLKKRDLFIKEQISKTLPQGGIGIIFMGLLHQVDELLPADIRVSYLIYRLPFHRGFEMELIS